jgi:hypothetical protein
MTEVEVVVRDSLLYDTQSEEQLLTLFFPKRTVTARELIRERVYQEVRAYNDRLPEVFRGLVTPSDAERVLNGYRMPKNRAIDAEKQGQLALDAFEQNGFILLVDDKQVGGLDDEIEIHPGASVVFLKLTPLVGG